MLSVYKPVKSGQLTARRNLLAFVCSAADANIVQNETTEFGTLLSRSYIVWFPKLFTLKAV